MTAEKLAIYQEQMCRKYFKKYGYNDPVCKAEIQVFISQYLANKDRSPTPKDCLAIEKGIKQLPAVIANRPAQKQQMIAPKMRQSSLKQRIANAAKVLKAVSGSGSHKSPNQSPSPSRPQDD